MKVIFVITFVCLLNFARGANYYFSSVSGSDSYTTSQAQNPTTPWKTISKLNSFFSSLKPGDSVLFKRDESYYGSVILKQSGSVTLPIVIGAYGSGKKPVITSLVTLAGWVSKGNGIWESYNALFGASVNMVLLNGVLYGMGRYPNADAPNKGYLNFESHTGKTSITDNQLSTATTWTGAELVLRPRHWILDRNLITAQSGTKISYANSLYEPYENYGYFIQNSIKTLDKFGEWYYDPSTKKLSVYFGPNGPSSYALQAATMADLVSSEKFSNVVIDNLEIKGANGSGFYIHNGSNITIQNCDIFFSGQNGIGVKNHLGLKIEKCTISDQNNNGIDVELGDNSAIRNNKIKNSYLVAGMGLDGEGMGIGINIYGNNSIVEYNEVRNTGFQGIYFNGSDITIKNNLIDSFCITKDDGAGIYTNKGAVVFKRRKVIGNIILNGIGTGRGTNDSNKVAAHGVYMDNNPGETDFRDNTIANCSNNGFNIHNSFGMTMENNTVFNNAIQLNMVQDADNVAVRNCIVTGNVLFSKLSTQWISSMVSSANDIKSFGIFDSNYYARPLDDRIVIYSSYVASNGSKIYQNFDLDGWKTSYGQDKHSKKTAKQVAPFKIDSLVGLNKFINGGDFSSNIKGISSSLCVLSQGTSGLLDGGYLQLAPTSRGSSFFFKVGSVAAGRNYLLTYSLRGAVDTSMSMAGSLRQSGAPYGGLTPSQSRSIDKSRTENEMLFSPSTAESAASIVFKMDNQSKFYVDNIKCYEAKAKITDPDDSIRFEYNPAAVNKSVKLNGNYIDSKGKTYSNNITLAPYTSAVLIKANDSFQNEDPSMSVAISMNDTVPVPFSSVTFDAVVNDPVGSVVKVEFYNDSTLLKTEYESPYTCTVDSIAPGNYSITAIATDSNGFQATSSPIVFSVPLNVAPVVSITSPAINSDFSAPATIEIMATATDLDGSIASVEFFSDSTLLTTEYKLPYSYTWDNVAAGDYTITVKATDDSGLTTTSTVLVSVRATQAARRSSSRDSGMMSNASSATNNKSATMRMESGKLLNHPGVSKLPDFRLSPDPATTTIQLSFDEIQTDRKANLTIQNISGAILKRYPVIISGRKIAIDISLLSPGIYILGLSGNNAAITKRFFESKLKKLVIGH